MKVVEHLERADQPLISFEIIPPLRGGTLQKLLDLIDVLKDWNPPFIDITSHAAEATYEETRTGIVRRVKRKRPGTLGVCALIQNKYNIDAVPHVLCQGFSREETEDFLIELRYLGIDNVLAIRGDDSGYTKPLGDGRSANAHACDLVQQVTDMNSGSYLDDSLLNTDPTNFCVGVAGYPEKHFEAPNIDSDVRYAKAKVDAGAEYIVTQMFFDNAVYFDYVERCRAAGIEVPIIPGLKILTLKKHLTSLPRVFSINIPNALSEEVERADPKSVVDIGVEWALAQTRELMEHDVPSVHFYIMSSTQAIKRLMKQLR
ncbi:MAG: methylenetetrahydrofolate reductase [Acidobacteriota bacterium]